MMSRMTFVSIRNAYLLEVRFRTAVVTILGRLIQVMYCPKTEAETMIRTTLEVPAMVSRTMGTKCLRKDRRL